MTRWSTSLLLVAALALPAFAGNGIDWNARQYGSRTDDGTIVIVGIPDYFWAYLENHHKVDRKRWDAEPEEQEQRLRHSARNGEAKKAHALYLKTQKQLEAAVAAGKEIDPTVEASITSVRADLGPAFADPLLKLRDQARTAKLKKKAEPRTQQMQQQGAALQAADVKGKGEKLDAAFENREAGRKGGEASSLEGKALVGAGAKGGQLTDAGAKRAAARYGDDRIDIHKMAREDLKAETLKPPVSKLQVADLRKRGYTDENIRDLGVAIKGGSESVQQKITSAPTYWGGKMGSGTFSNIEDTITMASDEEKLRHGCISFQQTTLNGIPKNNSIEAKPVIIGKILEHHAVVAYPKPPEDVRKDPVKYEAWWREKGVVIDGWKQQTSDTDKMTYSSVETWRKDFLVYRFMGARLEEE